MADIVDWNVIVLAPKEGNGGKFLAMPDHVECGGLSLTLCDNPVFDPNVVARVRVGPACNVTSGKYPFRARFETGVHDDPAIDGDSGFHSEISSRTDTYASNHKITVEGTAVL